MKTARTLIVGIGSPYGYDRLGWRVAESVKCRARPDLTVRAARSPSEIFDWMDGVERMLICDACQGSGPAGTWRCLPWPTDAVELTHANGSHDLGLAAVLTLAERLGQLPPRTLIWVIEAPRSASHDLSLEDRISAEFARAVLEVTRSIEAELSRA